MGKIGVFLWPLVYINIYMGVGSFSNKRTKGFTIVELLIVIVVIGILAAIVIVAYNGVQQRSRDSRRQNDIQSITQALELYYIDNGRYPAGSGSSAAVGLNNQWSTTADGSWANLVTILKPYMGNVPSDPTSTAGAFPLNYNPPTGYNYSYYSGTGGACGITAAYQVYILVYRLESSAQVDTLNGECTGVPTVSLYGGSAPKTLSNYRVVK